MRLCRVVRLDLEFQHGCRLRIWGFEFMDRGSRCRVQELTHAFWVTPGLGLLRRYRISSIPGRIPVVSALPLRTVASRTILISVFAWPSL